jgi:hypothetical protein
LISENEKTADKKKSHTPFASLKRIVMIRQTERIGGGPVVKAGLPGVVRKQRGDLRIQIGKDVEDAFITPVVGDV